MQRELFPNVLLELGYMGNKAVKMPVDHNFNGTPLQYLSTSPTRDQAAIDRLSANVANPFAGLLPGTGLNGSVVARSQLLGAFPQYSGAAGVVGTVVYRRLLLVPRVRLAHRKALLARLPDAGEFPVVEADGETQPPERQ